MLHYYLNLDDIVCKNLNKDKDLDVRVILYIGHVFCVLKGFAFLNEYYINLNHINLKLRELNSIKEKLEY